MKTAILCLVSAVLGGLLARWQGPDRDQGRYFIVERGGSPLIKLDRSTGRTWFFIASRDDSQGYVWVSVKDVDLNQPKLDLQPVP